MFLVDLEDVWFGISKVAEAAKVRGVSEVSLIIRSCYKFSTLQSGVIELG